MESRKFHIQRLEVDDVTIHREQSRTDIICGSSYSTFDLNQLDQLHTCISNVD